MIYCNSDYSTSNASFCDFLKAKGGFSSCCSCGSYGWGDDCPSCGGCNGGCGNSCSCGCGNNNCGCGSGCSCGCGNNNCSCGSGCSCDCGNNNCSCGSGCSCDCGNNNCGCGSGCSCGCCQGESLQAASLGDVAVAPSSQIPFALNVFSEGSAITHQPGSGDFVISCPGTYLVQFSCSAYTLQSVSQNASVGLAVDDQVLTHTMIQKAVTAAGGAVNLATQSLIQVPAGSQTRVSVYNTGDAMNFLRPNMTIAKV